MEFARFAARKEKEMTNYEWLVSTHSLAEFLGDISKSAAKWLQAEHKDPEKWVRLCDVREALRGIPYDINRHGHKHADAVIATAHDIVTELNIRISKIETKEIDE
jgi:hypothetical protein